MNNIKSLVGKSTMKISAGLTAKSKRQKEEMLAKKKQADDVFDWTKALGGMGVLELRRRPTAFPRAV